MASALKLQPLCLTIHTRSASWNESKTTENDDNPLGSPEEFCCYLSRTLIAVRKVMNGFGFSEREKRHRGKGRFMKKVSKKQARELAALARMPDDKIDLTDAPEIRDWRSAVVGKFYRPIKTPVTIRVDADVLAWLKRQGRGYQTRINQLLREAMEAKSRRRA